jgi:hypothetical protein
MGSISIFALEFSGTKFAVSRDFIGGYRLQASDLTISMMPATASSLAFGGQRIRLRARLADRRDAEMESGAVFRRDFTAVDGRVVHVELGVSDAGDVYLEIGTTRMTLDMPQAHLLLAVLDRLTADVASLAQNQWGGEPHQGNVVPGMREALDRRLPPWAREYE